MGVGMIGLHGGRNAVSDNFLFIALSLRANLKMATKYVDIFNYPLKVVSILFPKLAEF